MPNAILYAKDLSDKQKLLYVMISSLCAEKGYCWASNKYLAEKLGFKESWASKQITDLGKKGYIKVVISRLSGNKRTIALEGQTMVLGNHTYGTGVPDPYGTGVLDSNTSTNSTIDKEKINKKKFGKYVSMTEEEYNKLCDKRGRKDVDDKIEDVNIYCGKSGKKYKDYYAATMGFLKRDLNGSKPKATQYKNLLLDDD